MKRAYLFSAAIGAALLAVQPLGARTVEPGQPAQPTARAAQVAIIHAGKLMAEPGKPVLTNATIVTEAGKVRSIQSGFLDAAALGLPADTAVIDLASKYVLPGFIDLHVHLQGGGIAGRMSGLKLREPDEFFTLNAYNNGLATLMAGFTTVRDLGSSGDTVFALRDAIKLGIVAGPKIIASGEGISPTNGHADAHGLRRDLLEAQHRSGVCDGPDDCRRAVRDAVKYGADVIKVHVTGGVLDESNAGTNQQFSDAEIAAISETAHMLGRKVTTHAHGKNGINSAVRSGYNSIEHGMWADEEIAAPDEGEGHLADPDGVADQLGRDDAGGNAPRPVQGSCPQFDGKAAEARRPAQEAGAHGDQDRYADRAGHRQRHRPARHQCQEFLEYVDAGMTPVEALKTGTINAAAAAGVPDIGRLAPGLAADIIALDGDPVADINAVTNVDFVMRDGIVFKRAGAEVRE